MQFTHKVQFKGKCARILLCLVILLIFVIPYFRWLGKYYTDDEYNHWLSVRIPLFWHSYESKDFERTLVSDKPGTFLMWTVGFLDQRFLDKHSITYDPHKNFILRLNNQLTAKRLRLLRSFCVLVVLLVLFVSLIVIARGFNLLVAFFVGLFVLSDPTFRSLSKLVITDVWAIIFVHCALILALVSFREKSRWWRWGALLLITELMAFAILTRYSAYLYFPYIYLTWFLGSCHEYFNAKDRLDSSGCPTTFKIILTIAAEILVSLLLLYDTVYILSPYLWGNARKIGHFFRFIGFLSGGGLGLALTVGCLMVALPVFLQRLFQKHKKALEGKISILKVNVVLGAFLSIFLIQSVFLQSAQPPWIRDRTRTILKKHLTASEPDEMKWGVSDYFCYFRFAHVIPATTLPEVTLFLVMIAPIIGFFRIKKKDKDKVSVVGLELVMYLIIYGLMAALTFKRFTVLPRYILPLYLCCATICAIAAWRIWEMLKTNAARICMFVPMIIVHFISTQCFLLPPSTNYINLFRSRSAEKYGAPNYYNICGDWGEGSSMAAHYLNKKPNARELKVMYDYTGFEEFFVGESIRIRTTHRQGAKEMSERDFFDNIDNADYLLLTRRRISRFKWASDFFDSHSYETTISQRGVDFVYIYDLRGEK